MERRTKVPRLASVSSERNTQSLLGLPPELVEEIIKWLPHSELLPLRSVCKSLNEISFSFFGEAFFSEKVYLVSNESSMRALEEVSKHERLATCVRHIQFSIPKLRCWSRAELLAEYMIANLGEGLEDEYDEDDLDPDPFYFEVLLSSFKNFTYLKLNPTISFQDCDNFGKSNQPKRFKSSLQVGPREEVRACWDPKCCSVVYKALAKSSYAASELDLARNDTVLPIFCFTYHPHRICVEYLRVLRLRVWPYCHTEDNYISAVQSFVIIMAKARNLEQLTLHLEDEEEKPTFRGQSHNRWRGIFLALASRLKFDNTSIGLPHEDPIFPKLKYLELENHVIEFDLLLRFCRERKETLKKVVFGHIINSEAAHPIVVRRRIKEAIQGCHDGEVEIVLYDFCYGWDLGLMDH